MNFEFIFSIRNLWVGIYWEKWPDPYRLDVWISFFLLSIHICLKKV